MYRKELFVFIDDRPIRTVIRNYEAQDFQSLIRVQEESFPPPFPSDLWWNEKQLSNHVHLFPEGALCMEVNGEIVGSMTTLIVDFDPNHLEHSWEEITDNGYISNHNPNGNTLYVVDVCVRPAYRKYGVGKWLMQSMYDVVVHLGLERLVGGGRIPGYHKVANDMTAKQYVEKVIEGHVKDPVVTFLLRCGRIPIGVVAGYLDDAESCDYAALMEWKNPYF
jgi:ribosomal protein S18 acetylase RimI-like enzyme